METPREVLFRTMHDNWSISNKKLAQAILLEGQVSNGRSPLKIIEVGSSLSRYVVHVRPGECTYGWLAPYETSVPKVLSLVRRSKRPHSNADIASALSGAATDDMRLALNMANLDGALFANASRAFANSSSMSASNAAEALAWLFVVAGCSGDPALAVELAFSVAAHLAGADALQTVPPTMAPAPKASRSLSLGAYRCREGVILSEVYRFSEDPQGTEIGSLSLAEGSINDVGEGVSRRHVRIWRDDEGSWWVEGLGSTYGTVRVSDFDRTTEVVEPPRLERQSDEPTPVRILPGDRLVLAGTTEFVLVALSSST